MSTDNSWGSRAGDVLGSLAMRMDDWKNAVTALGTARDKTAYTRFVRRHAKSDIELEALFDFDDMANLIACAEPEAALGKGFEVRLDTPDMTTALHEDQERLGVRSVLLDALIKENVYGGAAIFLGADDGQAPDLPLNMNTINSFDFVLSVDCRDLVPVDWYTDQLDPKFGRARIYDLRSTNRAEGSVAIGSSKRIHESRLVVLRGGRCSPTMRRERQGWGASRIDRSYKALQIFADNWSAVSHIMSDASQGVFSIKGLIEKMGTPMKSILLERMRQIDTQRSVARSITIDSDVESFERKDTSMSGLPDLLDRTSHRLAASARMPVSILMGREPAGMNATGEMDMRAWYDRVAIRQTHDIAPEIRRISIVEMSAKNGPTNGVVSKKVDICFPPLWTATPAERAALEQSHATTDAARIQSGVLTPEEVAIARYRPEGYQDTIMVDTAHHEEALEQIQSGELPPVPVAPDDSPEARGTGEAPIAAVAPEDVKDPSTALNGAQISSLLEIVTQVATGQIPRETGIAIITSAFPINTDQAEIIMGSVGRGFVPRPENTSGA